VLIARLDNAGDVLLTGPAVRAVAAGAGRVTYLCGSAGRPAAALLPGVDEVVVYDAPWVAFDAPPVERAATEALVDRLAMLGVDRAFVLTSFHQSPLPLALLLRLAGVAEIAATSVDFPGTLLDVRHAVVKDAHEVEQALSLVATLGYRLPPGDDGRLAVRRPLPATRPFTAPYVVVHPGASVPARAIKPDVASGLVDRLVADRWPVVVTGADAERDLVRLVTGDHRDRVVDLAGAHDLAALAGVLDGAAAVVTGNTGPAHLAAAVGTPVVSVFAPVVPLQRWRPWGVRVVVLGDQKVPCAGCRARTCPVPGQPCLAAVTPDAIANAVALLTDCPTTVPA
jgi:ADP-heptose:LPS heptosyltransferase